MANPPFVRRISSENVNRINMTTVVDADTDLRKVDLTRGMYRTDMGLPWVLPVIQGVKKEMAKNEFLDHEYLPPFGLKSFRYAVTKLVLGRNSQPVEEGRLGGVIEETPLCLLQTVYLYTKHCQRSALPISSAGDTCDFGNAGWTLENSTKIESEDVVFLAVGYSEIKHYRYYDKEKRRIDIDGMLEDLMNIPNKSVVVIQGCCHNPTGCVPSKDQWTQIANAINREGLYPVMDMSFIGLATGDTDEDAYPARLFMELNIDTAIFLTFAKNFLLYNTCTGAAIFKMEEKKDLIPMKSHLGTMIFEQYYSPPFHGAQIVSTILNDTALFNLWEQNLSTIIRRIKDIRNAFVDALERHQVPGDWSHLRNGVGTHMIIYLTDRQVQHLIFYHHIYIMKDGQIDLCGLNNHNVNYVAQAIANAVKEYPRRYDSKFM